MQRHLQASAHIFMCVGVRERQIEREGGKAENLRAFETLEADIGDIAVTRAQRVDHVHKGTAYCMKKRFL